jgi:hypothetical protein
MKTAGDWLIKEIGGDLYEHRCSAIKGSKGLRDNEGSNTFCTLSVVDRFVRKSLL